MPTSIDIREDDTTSNPGRRGFLAAAASIAGMTAMVYSAMNGTLTLTEVAKEDEAAVSSARVAVRRMSRELSMAYVSAQLNYHRRLL